MGNEAKWIAAIHNDIGFVARLRPSVHTDGDIYSVDFEVFEIFCWTDDDVETPSMKRKGWRGSADTPIELDSLDDAQVFASGHVKWDGCSNVSFHSECNMTHRCDREGLENIGTVLARVHDDCGYLMGRWA